MAASLRRSRFRVFTRVAAWPVAKCDCPVEKQPTVKRLVFPRLWISRNRCQGKQITL